MTCDAILASLAVILNEVECQESSPGHSVVNSPFMNLDGDFPEVHIIESGDGNLLLTDYGESLRNLSNSNVDTADSETRTDILNRVSSLLDVRNERGRFQVQVPPEMLGEGLLRMFQALAFVEDLIFTASPRDEAEFHSRVESLLSPIAVDGRITKNQEFNGKSGRKYRADFHVHRTRDVWIDAISASTSGSFQNQVNRAHAMWSDAADESVRRITLLDDTVAVMDRGAPTFLATVCHVHLWSKSEGFSQDVLALTASMSL